MEQGRLNVDRRDFLRHLSAAVLAAPAGQRFRVADKGVDLKQLKVDNETVSKHDYTYWTDAYWQVHRIAEMEDGVCVEWWINVQYGWYDITDENNWGKSLRHIVNTNFLKRLRITDDPSRYEGEAAEFLRLWQLGYQQVINRRSFRMLDASKK